MKRIELYSGELISVDDEFFESLDQHNWWKAGSKNKCYAGCNINRKTTYMHRVIIESVLGRSLDRKEEIDHIDGNGFNNQLSNLRIAGRSENMANMQHHKNSLSIYKGVHYRIQYTHPWQSKLMQDGKNIYLGYFDSEIEAATQYDLGALFCFGQYAQLNFPEKIKKYLAKLECGYIPIHKPRKEASDIKGVSFDNTANKWRVRISIDGEPTSLGMFETEDDAIEYLNQYRSGNIQVQKHDPIEPTSKYEGVTFRKDIGEGRWQAYIKVNGKRKYLSGTFETEDEAFEARKKFL